MDFNFILVFLGVSVIFALLWYLGKRSRKRKQLEKWTIQEQIYKILRNMTTRRERLERERLEHERLERERLERARRERELRELLGLELRELLGLLGLEQRELLGRELRELLGLERLGCLERALLERELLKRHGPGLVPLDLERLERERLGRERLERARELLERLGRERLEPLERELLEQLTPKPIFINGSQGTTVGEKNNARPITQNTKTNKHNVRLETATPETVILNRVFNIAVAIKELESPPIKEDDLPKISAAPGLVYHAPTQKIVKYRVEIQSPDCIIPINSKTFLLDIGRDSEIQYFQLTPKAEGTIPILINAYQVDDDELVVANTRTLVTAIVEAKAAYDVIEQTTEAAVREKLKARNQVFYALTEHFSKEELAIVCFQVGIDWENLEGTTKISKAMSLIIHFEHRGDVSQLIQIVKGIRSNALFN